MMEVIKSVEKVMMLDFDHFKVQVSLYGLNWYMNKVGQNINDSLITKEISEDIIKDFIKKNNGDFSKVIGCRLNIMNCYKNSICKGESFNSVQYLDLDGEMKEEDKMFLDDCYFSM